MGDYKWFVFFFGGFILISILFGITEKSALGAYGEQAVWQPIFDVVGTLFSGGISGVLGAIGLVFKDPGALLDALINGFMWNYATLDSGIGAFIKIILLMFLSVPALVTLGLTFIPGRSTT